MRKALEDKKMVQKARESLKAWQERKRKEFNLLCYSLQGFIQIDNFQDIPLQDRGKFDYVVFGRKALVRPKREIMLRMGCGKNAKYRLVQVEYRKG